MPSSQIDRRWHQSDVLQDNALQDPSRRVLTIYLPPGYVHQRSNAYPCIYLLAGFTNSGPTFLNHVSWGENMQQRLDRLILSGQCQPMIVVMPDCFTRYGGSQYLNSSATGRYQDYLLELVEFVDQEYHTIPHRQGRALIGKSSGGFGALRTAMAYPDHFAYLADHSGDKFFEKCYGLDLLRIPDLLATMDVEAVLEDPASFHPRTSSFYYLMNAAAMSACYAPNPEAPLGFDWPVDTYTGELRDAVWQRWKAHDPVALIESHAQALRGLDMLYFDCGNRDEYYIHLGCRLMSQRLQSQDIAHHYEEYSGTHRQTDHRYDRSLSLISAAMDHA